MFGTAIFNTNLYNSLDITLCMSVFLFAVLSDYLKDKVLDTYASKIFFWSYMACLFDAVSMIAYACAMYFSPTEGVLTMVLGRIYTVADSIFFLLLTMYIISNTFKDLFKIKKVSVIFTLVLFAIHSILITISMFLPLKMFNAGAGKIIYATSGPGMTVISYPPLALLLIVCIYIIFKKFKSFTKEEKLSFSLVLLGLVLGFIASLFTEDEMILTTAICEYTVLVVYLTTERKSIKLIDQMNEEQEKLNKSNELQKKFFSIISHDIRNPLNVIIGDSEYILNSNLNDNQVLSTTNDITSAAHELKDFINNILNISKISTGKEEITSVEYDITNVIREITGRLSDEIEKKKMKFKIDVNPEMKYLFISDVTKIKTIIMLIIKNIINNDSDNVSIKFDTKENENNGTDLIISINHTGSNFTKEDFNTQINDYIDTLSQNSETLKNDFLGMIIAREYVQMLNGNISYETNMNTWIDIKIPQELASDQKIKDTKMYQDAIKGGEI